MTHALNISSYNLHTVRCLLNMGYAGFDNPAVPHVWLRASLYTLWNQMGRFDNFSFDFSIHRYQSIITLKGHRKYAHEMRMFISSLMLPRKYPDNLVEQAVTRVLSLYRRDIWDSVFKVGEIDFVTENDFESIFSVVNNYNIAILEHNRGFIYPLPFIDNSILRRCPLVFLDNIFDQRLEYGNIYSFKTVGVSNFKDYIYMLLLRIILELECLNRFKDLEGNWSVNFWLETYLDAVLSTSVIFKLKDKDIYSDFMNTLFQKVYLTLSKEKLDMAKRALRNLYLQEKSSSDNLLNFWGTVLARGEKATEMGLFNEIDRGTVSDIQKFLKSNFLNNNGN